MISIDVLVTRVTGLQRSDLERWIANEWVRPDGAPDHLVFHDIDVARVQLIAELRDELDVNEAALPVVLSLLDQVYEMRRRLAELRTTLDQAPAEDLRSSLSRHLARRSGI